MSPVKGGGLLQLLLDCAPLLSIVFCGGVMVYQCGLPEFLVDNNSKLGGGSVQFVSMGNFASDSFAPAI